MTLTGALFEEVLGCSFLFCFAIRLKLLAIEEGDELGTPQTFQVEVFWVGKRLGRTLATLSRLLPLFARPSFLSLSLLRRLGSFLGRCDGFRPRFGHQPSTRQDQSVEEGRH